jgi:hypothetical protein
MSTPPENEADSPESGRRRRRRSSSSAPPPPPAPAPAPGGRGKLYTLLTLCVLVVCAWALLRTPAVEARLRSLRPPPAVAEPSLQELLASDPEIGRDFPNHEIGADVVKSFRPLRRGLLLVRLADCSSCGSADLKSWAKGAEKEDLTLVLFVSASKERAPLFAQQSGLLQYPIVADPARYLETQLNAVYGPRAYLYDPKWKLRWVQKDVDYLTYNPFKDPTFLKAVAALKAENP